MSGQPPPPHGPPYIPRVWQIGNPPEKDVDIPTTAVFLALFMGGAAMHMTIFQLNKRKGHKFFFSGLLFGFCMARIVTCTLRIASVCLPTDAQLALAAQIFTAAGVVIIFIVNVVFAQRMLRASHPTVGWWRPTSYIFYFLYFDIAGTIIAVITSVVQVSYTLNPSVQAIDRIIQKYGITTFAVISFVPIPLTLAVLLLPRRDNRRIDKFGEGRWRHQAAILLTGATLICFGASYRAGTVWLDPVPTTQPRPGYLGKAAFYIVNFTVEILTVYLYALTRVDKRFHVPDAAKPHKSYQKAREHNARVAAEGATSSPATEVAEPEVPEKTHERDAGRSRADTGEFDSETEVGSHPDLEKQDVANSTRPTTAATATWE